MLHRRTFLHLSALAGAQLAFQRGVRAQGYPDRPIALVVPFRRGTDRCDCPHFCRAPAPGARPAGDCRECGWSRGDHRRCAGYPGRADGYTLSAGNSTSHVGGPAIYPFAYDILNDQEPVALLSISPTLLVARKDSPPARCTT